MDVFEKIYGKFCREEGFQTGNKEVFDEIIVVVVVVKAKCKYDRRLVRNDVYLAKVVTLTVKTCKISSTFEVLKRFFMEKCKTNDLRKNAEEDQSLSDHYWYREYWCSYEQIAESVDADNPQMILNDN